MKNRLRNTTLLTLIVLSLLAVLHYIPTFTWKGNILKQVDLLSDVRLRPVELEEEPDSLLPPPSRVKPAFTDTCKSGMTCIEDYSDSTFRGMRSFYQALDEAQSQPRPIRIAYLGDSFIEADILTSDLRALLQQHYGGCGVGYVNITSISNGFRPTVQHSFGGWESHSAVDTVYFNATKQDLSGHYFIPQSGAYVDLKGSKKYAARLDTCHRSDIYFITQGALTLTAQVNGTCVDTRQFEASDELQCMSVNGSIHEVRWTVEHADSAYFYGATMDDKRGVIVDNFSLRGSSGLSLRSVPTSMLRQFNAYRPYDLIILQFGLNVATERGRNYDKYIRGMQTAVEHIKSAFPQASILIVSVGDRDYKTEDGEVRTMPGIKNLVRYQQNLAATCGVAFWNMFQAMGGDESMKNFVEAQPAMANYDYTHINFRGGKHLAELLYETLLYGKDQYDKRRAYEAEP